MASLKQLFDLSTFSTVDLDKKSSSILDKITGADKVRNSKTAVSFSNIIDSLKSDYTTIDTKKYSEFKKLRISLNTQFTTVTYKPKKYVTLKEALQSVLTRKNTDSKSDTKQDNTKSSSTSWGWILAIGATAAAFYNYFRDKFSTEEPSTISTGLEDKTEIPNISPTTENTLSSILDFLPKLFTGLQNLLSTSTITTIQPTIASVIDLASPAYNAPLGGELIITSRFGTRELLGRTDEHFGVDFRAAVGTPVYATEDGIIVHASENGGAGNMVTIQSIRPDGTRVQVRYMHLSAFKVQAGQHVYPGQVVGLTGGAKGAPGSGKSTGPHLHMDVQVTKNGQTTFIDPVAYLGNAERMKYSSSSTQVTAANFMYASDKKTKIFNNVNVVAPEYIPQVNAKPIKVDATVMEGIKLSTKAKNKKYNLYGLSYSDKYGSRPSKYSNPANVRPSASHEGQVGIEQTDKAGKFAIFSDPFYSIKAWVASTILSKPASDPYWTGKAFQQIVDINRKHNVAAPRPGKNLYNIMSHLAPASDNNNPETYTTRIINMNRAAFPQGLHSIVQLERSKTQFIAFMKAALATEQGTTVEDWYLDMCWEAIYNNGPAPLQDFLARAATSSSATVTESNKSERVTYVTGNQQKSNGHNRQ